MPRIPAPVDVRFKRLTVIEEVDPYRQGTTTHRQMRCRCACGTEVIVRLAKLRSGHTQSCGCLQKERTAKAKGGIQHGMRYHPLYKTWSSIKRRCLVPTDRAFKNYGARGITICDEWRDDPVAFINYIIETIGHRPAGMSLDRIDNDRGYEPGNLKWSTNSEQQLNSRRSKMSKKKRRTA